MSAVSYKQTTQVALSAVAFGIFPPMGVFGCGIACATTIIGYYGIEYLNKLHTSYTSRFYRVVQDRDFTNLEKKDIKQPIQRLEKIGRAREWSVDLKKQDKILQNLKEGCCYGAVSTLFHDIRKKGLSIEQSALGLNREDVHFRQLIHRYELDLQDHEKLAKKKAKENKTTPSKRKLVAVKKELRKYEEERVHLRRVDSLHSPALKSQSFSPHFTHQTYKYVFEKTTKFIPKDATIKGFVNIPEHVIGFQLAPNEYYIYDTYNPDTGGLLKFPDKDLFFTQLRTHVLHALPFSPDPKIFFQIIHFHSL